jgi:hypothetical protein
MIFNWNGYIFSFFLLERKKNDPLFFSLLIWLKCNGHIVLYYTKQVQNVTVTSFFSFLCWLNVTVTSFLMFDVPVPSFQAEYRRWWFVTIVVNDRFEMETMKRLTNLCPPMLLAPLTVHGQAERPLDS